MNLPLPEIDTPALVVDRAVLERNIHRMAAYCRSHGLALRPHIKTHKTPEIARMQLEAGAVGLTVAKLSEAEVMIDEAGARDLLVAYPVVGATKLGRLVELSRRARISVAVDSVEAARGIAASARAAGLVVPLLLDLDTGFGRTGFAGPERLLEAARVIHALEGVAIEGLFTFPGHVLEHPSRQGPEMRRIGALLSGVRDGLESDGIRVRVVSAGSTPTAAQSHLARIITEIRPGTYVFNDSNYLSAGAHSLEDCALTVHVTVVSDSVPGQVVVDGGSKTFSSDGCLAPGGGYGMVLDLPGARFHRCSEEHGWIDVSACPRRPRVGERLRILPNHVCPAVNLHDRLWIAEGDRIIDRWRVAARGAVT